MDRLEHEPLRWTTASRLALAALACGAVACRSATTPSALRHSVGASRMAEFEASAALESAPSEGYENIYRKMALSLGGFVVGNFDTSVQISSQAGIGAILDLEETLGVDTTVSAARLDGHYAFNRRHRLDLSLFDIDRHGTRTVGKDIEIGDTIIPAGEVNTTFDTGVVKLAYRYNFVTDERTVIGVSGGFHTMVIDTAFESGLFNVEETFKATVPLPVFGLHAAYALSDKWSMMGSTEFLQVSIGSIDGRLMDTRLGFHHDTFKHVGWGVEVNGFNFDVKAEGSGDLVGNIEYAYQGVMLYIRTFF